MTKKLIAAAVLLAAAIMLLVPSPDSEGDACQTKVSGSLPFQAEAVFASGGEEVCAVSICDRITAASLEPGKYTMSVRDAEGNIYYQKEIDAEAGGTHRFFATTISAGNSGWKYGPDYGESILLNKGKASFNPISEGDNGMKIVADKGDLAEVTFIPTDERAAHGFCPVYRALTLSSVKPSYKSVLPAAYEFMLTVPSGSETVMGMESSGRAAPFPIRPISSETAGDETALSYRLIPGYTYGFRVSLEGCADACCVMVMKKGLKAAITREEMESHPKDEIDAARPSEVLLNINAEGFLRMQEGDTFEINPQRNTYTDDDFRYGIFLRPQFSFRAMSPDGGESDAVEFDGNRMSAARDGTAFVLISCDAISVRYLNVPGMEDKLLSATSPECTGLFVVTVGDGAGPDIGVKQSKTGGSGRDCGNHFDSDLDVLYYPDAYSRGLLYIDKKYAGKSFQYNPVFEGGSIASFSKSPTGASDTWCRAKIVAGPNIVSVEEDGKVSYQVVRGMKMHMYAVNQDSGSVVSFMPGDRISFFATGIRVPASAQPYGADTSLTMEIFGEKYVCGRDGAFDTVTIPQDVVPGQRISIRFEISSSGVCPSFGSHRVPEEERESGPRSASFGTFTMRDYDIAEFYVLSFYNMAESGWDTYAEADAGIHGRTVDIGKFEVAAGQKLFLALNRTSQQDMFGVKSIAGAEGWMRCDADGSTADRTLLVAEPTFEQIGKHRFSAVVKLLNNRGTMRTTVTGEISVLESCTVDREIWITGKDMTFPGIREGTPIPDGSEFRSWNTEPDGTGKDYVAGELLVPESDMSFYAQYGPVGVGSTFLLDGLYYTILRSDDGGNAVEVTGCSKTYGKNLVIPESIEYGGASYSVESIGDRAFSGNKSIVTADLSAVGKVGYKSFPYCSNLESLRIRGSVYFFAFYSCTNLKTIEFTGETSLGTNIFDGCRSLSDVTFPESFRMGKNSFIGTKFYSEDGELMGDDQLARHRFTGSSRSLTLYRPSAGEEFSSDGLKYRLISGSEASLTGYEGGAPVSLAVPKSVRYLGFDFSVSEIGTKAFYGCADLTAADLGDVRAIGLKAFANCRSLASASLSGVEKIEGYAFYGCSSLESLEFCDGVSIGISAFYRCMGLKRIAFGEISSVTSNSFYGCLFWDPEAGKRISVSADSLSGMTFVGKATKLVPA